MKKTYDANGDVILSSGAERLCKASEQLYSLVDTLFLDEDQGVDLDAFADVYEDTIQKITEMRNTIRN